MRRGKGRGGINNSEDGRNEESEGTKDGIARGKEQWNGRSKGREGAKLFTLPRAVIYLVLAHLSSSMATSVGLGNTGLGVL